MYASFCAWFHVTWYLHTIHAATNDRICVAAYYSIIHIYPILKVHPSVSGPLGWLGILSPVSSAMMGVQVLV